MRTIAAINCQCRRRPRQTSEAWKTTIKKADTLATQSADLTYTLTQAESDMASGDPASWIYNTIRNFKAQYKVDIAVNGQLAMGDVDLLPKFPYKQLKVTVGGTAYYHDLGKFIADFENTYPHARIANLDPRTRRRPRRQQ